MSSHARCLKCKRDEKAKEKECECVSGKNGDMDFPFNYNYQLLERFGAAGFTMLQLVEDERVVNAKTFRDHKLIVDAEYEDLKAKGCDMEQVRYIHVEWEEPGWLDGSHSESEGDECVR